MKSWLVILALVVVGCSALGGSAGQQPTALPQLNKRSAKGLRIECHPSKAEYRVGDHVMLVCTITNATDTIKPIGWNSGVPCHFLITGAQLQKRSDWGGVLPKAYPVIPKPLLVKNGHSGILCEFILYLPPHDSITFHLSKGKADRAGRYRSRVVYHPLVIPTIVTSEAYFLGDQSVPPWRDECLVSEPFTYEVLEDEDDSVT